MAVGKRAVPPERYTLNEVFEAEQGLLGLILSDGRVRPRIGSALRASDWTERLHRGVFEVSGLHCERGLPVTVDAIAPHVSDTAPDGAPAELYLADLAARAPAPHLADRFAHVMATAAAERTMGDTDYDTDFYTWAHRQAERLRRGRLSEIDALNLAEEIEDLGREIYHRLESSLRMTLLHLLKWDHQPEKRTRSWTLSIRNGRMDAEELLVRHPGLKGRLAQAITGAYRRARLDAAGETGVDEIVFPATCPYDYETLMNRPIPWPIES